MLKAYKFRLYPNGSQIKLMNKNFGCVRFTYNAILRLLKKSNELGYRWVDKELADELGSTQRVIEKTKGKDKTVVYLTRLSKEQLELYKNWKPSNLSGELLKTYKAKMNRLSPTDFQYLISIWKRGNKFGWLREANSIALITAKLNLDTAYKNYFNKIKKGSSLEEAGEPKFKKKFNYNSIQDHQNNKVDVKNSLFSMGKIKNIKCVYHRELPADKIGTCTISKESDGKFYVSILVDTGVPLPSKGAVFNLQNSIGVDLGVVNLATTSDGNKFQNPRLLRGTLDKISYYQTLLSKMKGAKKGEKSSNNFKKIKGKIAKLHAKLTRQREYLQYDIVHKIIKDKDNVFYNDLDIKGMLRKPEPIERRDGSGYEQNGASLKKVFNKALADASLGGLKIKLKNKCDELGKNCTPVNEKNISKTCNMCGHINVDLQSTTGSFICSGCGAVIDGDINTAKNILDAGFIK